jgi:hypothetical protein
MRSHRPPLFHGVRLFSFGSALIELLGSTLLTGNFGALILAALNVTAWVVRNVFASTRQ